MAQELEEEEDIKFSHVGIYGPKKKTIEEREKKESIKWGAYLFKALRRACLCQFVAYKARGHHQRIGFLIFVGGSSRLQSDLSAFVIIITLWTENSFDHLDVIVDITEKYQKKNTLMMLSNDWRG